MARDRTTYGGTTTGVYRVDGTGPRRPVSKGRQGGVSRRQSGPREAAITKSILGWLNTLAGCYARKVAGGFFSSGWPDVVGCYGGRFFAIEVKQPGCEPTKLQAEEIDRWRSAGGLVIVAHSLEEVQAFMHEAFFNHSKEAT